MYKKSERNHYKHIDFMLLDLLCLQVAFILSYMMRQGASSPYLDPIYRNLAIVSIISHVCISFFLEYYVGIFERGYFQEAKKIIKYNFIMITIMLIYMFVTKSSQEYSRMTLLLFFFINAGFMGIAHFLYKRHLRKKKKDIRNVELMYVVTSKNRLKKTVEELKKNEYADFRLMGIFISDDDSMVGQTVDGTPIVAPMEDFLDYIRSRVVDRVFVNLSRYDKKNEWITESCLEMGVTVHINLDQITNNIGNSVVERINDLTVMTASINSVSSRQLFIKRAMDIAGSLVGLVLTGIAFIIFAPIIYMQSKGPILFSQIRIGKNGRKFKIYKFRTMYPDAEERKKELMSKNKMNGLMFKMDDDPRIIPIGHFLRKSSIDELPQFWNILKGDMSLVGTRPPTVDEYVHYENRHKSRLATKPGLTGMWQVSGRSDITDFEEVVRMDREYIGKWSIGLDVKIVAKTILVLLMKKGAV